MFLTVVVWLCWQKKFKSIVILPSERGRVQESSSGPARSENTRVLLFYRSESNPTQLNVRRSSEFVSCPFTLINRHELSTNDHQRSSATKNKNKWNQLIWSCKVFNNTFFFKMAKNTSSNNTNKMHMYTIIETLSVHVSRCV